MRATFLSNVEFSSRHQEGSTQSQRSRVALDAVGSGSLDTCLIWGMGACDGGRGFTILDAVLPSSNEPCQITRCFRPSLIVPPKSLNDRAH